MMYLLELVAKNGDKLVRYNETKTGMEYVSVFDYSSQYGGTYDSARYYNDYYVEVGNK